MEPSIEHIFKDLQIIKWMLISFISIFGALVLGIFYLIFKVRSLTKDNKFINSFYDEARDLLDKGLANEVIERSKGRIETHPKDKYAHWFLAMAYQDNKEYSKALNVLSTLKDIAPGWNIKYVEPHIDEIDEILRSSKLEVVPKKD